MTENKCKTVRLVYGIVFSAMTVILGALFIWKVLDVYLTGISPDYTGKFPFTAERVSERLSDIAPAFWIWIVMIVAGAVLWEVFPVKAKRTAWKDPRYSLYRLKKRIPAVAGEGLEESMNVIKREEKILRFLWLGCAVLVLAGIVYSIVYLAIPSHFPKADVTHEMLRMAANVFPWALAAFAVACGISVYERISAEKQLAHAKKLAAGNKPREVVHGKLYNILHHRYFLWGFRAAVGCIAVVFIIVGAFVKDAHGMNNMLRILEKAINICSECIGLG